MKTATLSKTVSTTSGRISKFGIAEMTLTKLLVKKNLEIIEFKVETSVGEHNSHSNKKCKGQEVEMPKE